MRSDRRDFLKQLSIAAAAVAGARWYELPSVFGQTFPTSGGTSRPNVLFVLIDDLRSDALGFLGHPLARTPNIDRVAAQGANLKNSFCSTPLCSPSRASFLTGQYAHTHGIVGNETKDLRNFATDDQLVTAPMLLNQAGYETAHVGKWHMDPHERPRPGFDRWVSFAGQGVYNDCPLNVDGRTVASSGYVTDVITDYAEKFIRQRRDRPFFLSVGHKAVHGPFEPANRHAGLFEDVPVPRAASINDDLSGKPLLKLRHEGGAEAYANWVVGTPRPGDKTIRNYFRCLAAVDEGLGRLLAALADTGQLDNTLIVIAGDNGQQFGEHGLTDKRGAYEESIRIPMIVRHPTLVRVAGGHVDQLVVNIDFAATVLDLADIAPPSDRPMHGRSLTQVLDARTDVWREAVLTEYFQEAFYPFFPDWKCVRTTTHKLIHYTNMPGCDELYDVATDPLEMTNLIHDPAHVEVAHSLREQLADLLTKSDNPAQLPTPLAQARQNRSVESPDNTRKVP